LGAPQEKPLPFGLDPVDPEVVKQIRSYTRGGVEYAFETAGVVPAMQTAYQITRRGGTTITSGLPHPKEQFSIPQVTLAAEERTIKGSYIGSCIPSRDIPRYIELYNQGRLPVNRLLTDTIPLEDINEGFDRLARGEAARLVVTM
jgi:alcohol dehydrogenase